MGQLAVRLFGETNTKSIKRINLMRYTLDTSDICTECGSDIDLCEFLPCGCLFSSFCGAPSSATASSE